MARTNHKFKCIAIYPIGKRQIKCWCHKKPEHALYRFRKISNSIFFEMGKLTWCFFPQSLHMVTITHLPFVNINGFLIAFSRKKLGGEKWLKINEKVNVRTSTWLGHLLYVFVYRKFSCFVSSLKMKLIMFNQHFVFV